MFEEYKIYGPYVSAKSGRLLTVLVSARHRTTMSYPRYLMSVHLNRQLLATEHVDHIDEDFTNNDLANLRLLSQAENNLRQSRGEQFVWLECAQCGKEFSRAIRQTRYRRPRKQPYCCNRSCAARYQKLALVSPHSYKV